MLNTITVSQLNNYVKSLLENDKRLNIISVSGEISNFKNHFSSGHWYFTLKDKNASVRCVMFKSSALKVKFDVEDGLAVVIKGRVSLYEKDGQYQFYAEEMHPVGEGDLALQFKQVKEKLDREGLFDTSTKRPLIKYPKRIAVVTSDTGAAVRDILNITSSRYPLCDIVMCPVLVQGDQAASDMIKTLDKLYTLDNIDAIIIGRGGGSAEDLHCFNDEALARKIYESPFPVISAVGHETDFTICDFVADVRASTPSHAAELSVPDCNDLYNRINFLNNLLVDKISNRIDVLDFRLKSLDRFLSFSNFKKNIQSKQIEIDRLSDTISNKINEKMQNHFAELYKLTAKIDALSPLKVLMRGFSLITKENEIITDADSLKVDDIINVQFYKGKISAKIVDANNNVEVQ